MKRYLAAIALAVALAAGVGAHEAPARTVAFEGERVTYKLTSLSPVNNISYYNASGNLVFRYNVRFTPTLINIGGPPMHWLEISFYPRQRLQYAGATVTSRSRLAQCQIRIDDRIIELNEGSGPRAVARC